MEEFKFNDDVIEQIKDFDKYWNLTEEQKLLIDKLILNEELKNCYKAFGLCKECKQPNTGYSWCQQCDSKRLQQNFKNWTSGNPDVDKLIQESQLNTNYVKLEWVEYDRFENIKYIAKGGFGKVYKANFNNQNVALKCLNNSKDITSEFLNEVILQ